jgi:hypothetical protein
MSETTMTVARNLREIRQLAWQLQDQAIHKANDRLMPGGEAMVNLAYVADLAIWTRRVELAEQSGGADLVDEDPDDLWPPFQRLRYWSEAWRSTLGMDYDDPRWRPTLASEAAFLANPDVLGWAWDNEPRWDNFADDVTGALRRLENILAAGERDVISDDITCLACETPLRRRMTADGYEDEWWCRTCYRHLNQAQYNLATAQAARRALLPSCDETA